MQHARALAVEAEVPIEFGDYVRGRELGHGSSGRVFTCTRRGGSGCEQWAAKAIDLRRMRLSAKADRELKKLQREIDILKRVPPHRNLVRFIDSLEEGNWCFLVLEFVSGGDLFSTLIRRAPQPRFSETETVFVLRQLVEGLDILHKYDVIHRDLKLENILVTGADRAGDSLLCTIKITDFGLSKVVGDGLSIAHSTVGSPRYIAPEVLATGAHDFRADLWSLGVLLYVLLAGRFPFEGSPNFPQRTLDIAVEKLGISDEAQAVVGGLMQLERSKRLTLQELRAHPLLISDNPNRNLSSPSKRPRITPALGATTASLFGSEDKPALVVSEDSVKLTKPACGQGEEMPHFSPIYLDSQDSVLSAGDQEVAADAPAEPTNAVALGAERASMERHEPVDLRVVSVGD